jgi:hypothetical protein
MPSFIIACLTFAILTLPGCGGSLRSQPPPQKWTAGFWFWYGSAVRTSTTPEQLDVVFFQAGVLQKEKSGPHSGAWKISGDFPDELPRATEYWLVLRCDRQVVPDLGASPVIARRVAELRSSAEQRKLNLVGVQLDIDSPTGSLREYAKFLHEVRRAVPSDMGLSITALLDWFRDDGAVGDVINEVDEFVPQFYDLGAMVGPGAGPSIASNIDAVKWSPVFNRFNKRFRIGIASFGRARRLRESPSSAEGAVQSVYVDLVPADLSANPAASVQTSRNAAKELVLTYRVSGKPPPPVPGFVDLPPGESIQFIVPTQESIQAGVEGAKRLGGYCAGVLFFRWPGPREALTMDPDAVLAAAGIAPGSGRPPGAVQVVDGGCAAVKCMDLYLLNAEPLRASPVRLGIQSSLRLEYFLPRSGVPARMVSPSDLELLLPAYGGRRSLYLGRAVAKSSAQFTVREKK